MTGCVCFCVYKRARTCKCVCVCVCMRDRACVCAFTVRYIRRLRVQLHLARSQRDRLEDIIRTLTPARRSVGEAMAWCLEHAEAAGEVAACLAEALAQPRTAPPRRVARLYLLSDVLHNAGAKLTNASAYRGA